MNNEINMIDTVIALTDGVLERNVEHHAVPHERTLPVK